MACAEIVQTLDLEVSADMTVEIFLSFFAGAIIALILILIMLFIRYRKIIITKVSGLAISACTLDSYYSYFIFYYIY